MNSAKPQSSHIRQAVVKKSGFFWELTLHLFTKVLALTRGCAWIIYYVEAKQVANLLSLRAMQMAGPGLEAVMFITEE